MTPVKIKKPVTIGGAIHRPNKLGNIAVVDDKHAKILIEGGYADKAPAAATPTLGVTVQPNTPPPVVHIATGEPVETANAS